LNPLVAAAIAGRDAAELTTAFEASGVTWGPYQTLRQAVTEDHYFNAANPMLSEIDHPSRRRYLTPGAAATLAGEPRGPVKAAPSLGADTDAVLSEVLGLSSADISRLRDAGVAG
jgi:2-methylfumaryl-CoA isomerase